MSIAQPTLSLQIRRLEQFVGAPLLQRRREGALAYSMLGLLIFTGFTMFDFRRLRTNADIASAPILAVSIFLGILNVF